MSISFVESRGDSWNAAADGLVAKLKGAGAQHGQIVSISAHNNGPNDAAIFSAHWSASLPARGALDLTYKSQNSSSYGWDTFYENAGAQAIMGCNKNFDEQFVAITGSCNSGGSAVTYVWFYESAAQPGPKRSLKAIEARANSWNGAADKLLEALSAAGVQQGQLLGIDAHNNGPMDSAIFSAFYSPDREGGGPLDVAYISQNTSSYGWDMFYTNAAAKGMQLEKWSQQLISITGSCNEKGKAVLYNFFYTRPQGVAALSLSEPGDGSDVFLSYKQKDGTDGLATKLFYELKPKEVWFDKMRGSSRSAGGMGAGVANTKVFLALISPQYFESKWCLLEMREAVKIGKQIMIAYNGSTTEVAKALQWIPAEFKDLTKDELVMLHEDDEFFQVSKKKLLARMG